MNETKEYLQNLRQITILADKASWSHTQLFEFLRSRYQVNSKYALNNSQAIELCEYLKQQVADLKPQQKTKLWRQLMTDLDD